MRDGARSADEASETSVGGASVGDDVVEALALQLLVAQEDASAAAASVAQRPGRAGHATVIRGANGVSHAADRGDD